MPNRTSVYPHSQILGDWFWLCAIEPDAHVRLAELTCLPKGRWASNSSGAATRLHIQTLDHQDPSRNLSSTPIDTKTFAKMPTQPAGGQRTPQPASFTETMRDRQARGKGPEEDSDEFEYVPSLSLGHQSFYPTSFYLSPLPLLPNSASHFSQDPILAPEG